MKQIQIVDDDEREMETAGQSILTNMVEQEVNESYKFVIITLFSSTLNVSVFI